VEFLHHDVLRLWVDDDHVLLLGDLLPIHPGQETHVERSLPSSYYH